MDIKVSDVIRDVVTDCHDLGNRPCESATISNQSGVESSECPNAVTIVALEEGEKILQDPDTPRYNSIAELRAALLDI